MRTRLTDPFEVLGFDIFKEGFDSEKELTTSNIAKVSKKLMLRVHPDKNKDIDVDMCND